MAVRNCCYGTPIAQSVLAKVDEVVKGVGQMRRPTMYRAIQPEEIKMVKKVFGPTTFPYADTIGIGDGLGYNGRPWTSSGPTSYQQMPQMNYQINVGDAAFSDMTKKAEASTFVPGMEGTVADLLVHEMTHVWQYFRTHGRIHLWASSLTGDYGFKAGKAWKEYDVEQQASIVEKWFAKGELTTDELFPYVYLVVRSAGHGAALDHAVKLSLAELTRDVEDLRRRGRL